MGSKAGRIYEVFELAASEPLPIWKDMGLRALVKGIIGPRAERSSPDNGSADADRFSQKGELERLELRQKELLSQRHSLEEESRQLDSQIAQIRMNAIPFGEDETLTPLEAAEKWVIVQ